MTSRLRVAHFGPGHTGTQIRRPILQRPDPELVGKDLPPALSQGDCRACVDFSVVIGVGSV